jgi:hypothetical protein
VSNYSIVLNGPITVYDSGNNLILSQTLTNLKTPVNSYSQGSISVSAAAAAISLPASQTNFAYLQNLGPGLAVVSWTPQSGSGAVVQDLGISSGMVVAQVATTAATGVSAITVSSSAAVTLNYLLGG